jgi:hypothetical protein
MSWQNGSDIGVQIDVAARDGIRLEIARLPMRVVDEGDYRLVEVEVTEASRWRWIQAASPPPPRVDGCPWYGAFGPADRTLPEWLQAPRAASPYDGLAKLARPSAETIVLDQQVELFDDRERKLEFARPAPGEPRGFPANEYPLPVGPVEATAYVQCQLAWRHPLQAGAWVALSFDRFDPNALSTAFLVKVSDAWLFGGPEAAFPKGAAAG